MIKLIESGLFGGRLIAVDTPEMVERYNECLTDIGLPNTKLNRFHIDGWGWSPEVADELDDRYYLCHGIANPYGIIISPRQKECSLYFPIHSFDWDIHQHIFGQFETQITEITTLSGLWFELDQEITTYRSARDLLLVEGMNIRFKSPDDLMKASRDQKGLVKRYNDDTMGWHSAGLRREIIDSAKQFGDLRFRHFEIEESRFSQIQSFYTPGFGGVYTIKNSIDGKPVLVFDQLKSEISGESGNSHIEFNIDDARLVPYLYANQLVDDKVSFYKDHLFLLEYELEQWFIKKAMEFREDVVLSSLTSTQRKGFLNKLIENGLLGNSYLDFEALVRSLKKGKVPSKVPSEQRSRFIHPHPKLDSQTKGVVWQILCALFDQNELLNYTFNKSQFYLDFQQWKEPYQDWVIEKIKDHRGVYLKLMK
jgi:hypothetical protein